jgi:hypothetical protein
MFNQECATVDRSVHACSREKARDSIFYSYTKNINGFAANLEPAVAAAIAGEPARSFC